MTGFYNQQVQAAYSALAAVASTVSAFGDSFTAGGNAAVPATGGYAPRYAVATGKTLTNKGIAGTILQNSVFSSGAPQSNNGRDRFLIDLLGPNKRDELLLNYGFNDARYTAAPSTINLTGYQKALREVLNGCRAGGYTAQSILLGTPWWISDTGLNSGGAGFTGQTRATFETFVQAAKDIGAEYGTKVYDVYAYMRDNGGVSLIDPADNIHPLDTAQAPGHQVIAAGEQLAAVTNTLALPTNVTASASGSTLTVAWAYTVPGGKTLTNYEVQLGPRYDFTYPTTATQALTTHQFLLVPGGVYNVRVRAAFADGTFSPWAFLLGTVIVGAGDDFATLTSGTLLENSTYTRNSLSTGNAQSLGSDQQANRAVGSVTTQNTTQVYQRASNALPSGGFVYGEAWLDIKSNTSSQLTTAIYLRGNNAASQNYLMVMYNGTNIRIMKVVSNTVTVIATLTRVLTAGTRYKMRFECGNAAQRVFIDDVSVLTATEAENAAWGNEQGLRFQNATSLWTATTGPQVLAADFGASQ